MTDGASLGKYVSIMVTALEYDQAFTSFVHFVDEAIFLIDAARPASGKIEPERFRLPPKNKVILNALPPMIPSSDMFQEFISVLLLDFQILQLLDVSGRDPCLVRIVIKVELFPVFFRVQEQIV